jgi:hypothetical protein
VDVREAAVTTAGTTLHTGDRSMGTATFRTKGQRSRAWLALASTLWFTMACAGEERLKPSRLDAVAPPAAQVTVGSTQAIVFRVVADNGRAVRGVTVNFTTTFGSGAVAPVSAVTNARGEVQAQWTVGTVPVQSQMTATVNGQPIMATMNTAVVAGPPASMVPLSDALTEGLAGALVVAPPPLRVRDGFGNPVSGARVTFTVTAGGGTVSAAAVTANSQGLVAPNTWRLGLGAAINTLTATTAGVAPVPVRVQGVPFDVEVVSLHFNQGNQDLGNTVGAIAGRPGWVRVVLRANRPINRAAPTVRVRLILDGAVLGERVAVAGLPDVPTGLELDDVRSTWNVVLSADDVRPGLAVQAVLVPDANVPDSDPTNDVFPRGDGAFDLNVRSLAPLRIRWVPMTLALTGTVGNITPANEEQFLTDTKRWLAVSTIETSFREGLITDRDLATASGWSQALGELQAVRAADGAWDEYYHGILRTPPGSSYAGIGYLPGLPASAFRSALSADNLPLAATVVAHELGHNLGRPHAPCGAVAGPDRAFPHENGRIGWAGVDILNPQAAALIPSTYADFMSYCSPRWTSDHTMRRLVAWRRDDPRARPAATVADAPAAAPGLLVWGRITPSGVQLEPAFEVSAPATPRDPRGDVVVRGIAADGRELFTWRLESAAVDHSAQAERHFAAVVPLASAVREQIARLEVQADGRAAQRVATRTAFRVASPALTVVAADGAPAVRVQWDVAQYPAVMVREAGSGRVRGFLRSGRAALPTAASAGLEYVVSDGVQSWVVRP